MKIFNYILSGFALLIIFSQCSKDSAGLSAAPGNGAGGSTARFTIVGNYMYVVDHTSLKSFNVSNPNAPSYKSKTEIGFNIETIFPYKDKLFIGSSNFMYIYSLANPENPVQLAKAEYIVRGACDPVVARDSVAYSTLRGTGPCGGGQSALVAYNIKDIAHPQLMATVPLTGPYGLGIKNNTLYVCEGTQGMRIFNITDAYNPVQSGTIANKTFYDVIPLGNVLIGQTATGFALYDISNPAQPIFQAEINN